MQQRYSTLLLLLLTPLFLSAQSSLCDGSRFFYEMGDIADITTTTDVVYGSNKNSNDVDTELAMDIYEPPNDTASNRPVIIFAHGGSFIGGNRTQGEITQFCESMAIRGYVTATISYRLQPALNFSSADSAIASVGRAMQDMKAAVRFFRKDVAENGNTYGVDTNLIFVGGSSAGAVTALHLGYITDEAEFKTYSDLTDTNMIARLGGIEGTSGNPGYRSDVQGVINLCGALGDKSWIADGDVPLISMHGTEDNTVPYGEGAFEFPPFLTVPLDGSSAIHQVALDNGVDSEFWTWEGQDHVPYVNAGADAQTYADSTTRFMSVHMYDWVCDEPAPENFIVTNVADELTTENFGVYPNPAGEVLRIKRPASVQAVDVRLYNTLGQTLLERPAVRADELWLPRAELPAGLYVVELTANGQRVQQKLYLK